MAQDTSKNRSPSNFHRKKRRERSCQKWIETMNVDTSDPSITSYYTSEVTELVDDKDIAACAVALVIASARKGIVVLCANIARILKENAKLEQKLRHYINKHCNPNDGTSLFKSDSVLSSPISKSKVQIPGKARHCTKVQLSCEQSFNTENQCASPSKDHLKHHTIVTTAIIHSSEFPEGEAGAVIDCSRSCAKNRAHDDSSATELPESDKKTCKFKQLDTISGLDDISASSFRWPSMFNNDKLVHCGTQTDISLINTVVQEIKSDSNQANCYALWKERTGDVGCLEKINNNNKTGTIHCDTELDCDCKTAQYWKNNYIESCRYTEQLRKDLKTFRERNQSGSVHTEKVCDDHFTFSSAKTDTNAAIDNNAANIKLFNDALSETDSRTYVRTNSDPPFLTLLKRRPFIPILAPSPLFGCKCAQCESTLHKELAKHGEAAEVFRLLHKGKPVLELNDQVMIPGNCIGHVSYIGHLDGTGMPAAVFVGITLRDQKGNTNGCHNYKKYFSCPMNYGIFLPINSVLFIVSRAIAMMNN